MDVDGNEQLKSIKDITRFNLFLYLY